MPKLEAGDLKTMMGDLPNVRNVMTVGPMGSGKTCALDCLGAKCGLVAEDKIGEVRFAHTRQDERERGCTIKTSVTSMAVDDLLLHMVDTPGHTEFSAELSVAAPLADGALVVVDAGRGGGLAPAALQQVKVLMDWYVAPVLFCNKIDVPFLVTKKSAEEIVDDLTEMVDAFNIALAAAPSAAENPTSVNAEAGGVLFGSTAHGWAFTIPQLASTYASKFKTEVETMSKRMWGEWYYTAKTKTWSTAQKEDSVRGFISLIINPIKKVQEMAEGGDLAKLEKMMEAVGVTLSAADKKLTGQPLFHRCMQQWMPAGTCIAKGLRQFVPDPVKSQAKRFTRLTSGNATDPAVAAVKECAAGGTMIFSCAKLVPQPAANGRFYALGRVFSGTVQADKCFLLDEDYIPPHAREAVAESGPSFALPESAGAEEGDGGDAAEDDGEAARPRAASGGSGGAGSPKAGPADAPDGAASPASKPGSPKAASKGALVERRVQGVVACQGKAFIAVAGVPAGNICAVGGIDQYILKRSTMVGSADLFPMRKPVFVVSPVLRVSLQPKNPKDLPKLVEALRRLAKSCPVAELGLEDSGRHVVGACGAEHMRMLRHDLETDYLPGVEIGWNDPCVQYCETVTHESSMMCLSKSPNKHNRLFVKAEPLSEENCVAIETQRVQPMQDIKIRSKILEKEFGWDKTDTLKIWGFGPAPEEAGAAYGANVLVDQTKQCQYMGEIKESVNAGLLWATLQGPLCEERMRGLKFNLLDVKLHADSIHRGMGQIQPTARRVFFAATMTAGARLMEPIFSVNIDASADAQPGIMQALGACRGELVIADDTGGRLSVQAFVPVSETIGTTPFATVLSQKTSGKASGAYTFDHWGVVPSDPMLVDARTGKANSKGAEIMLSVRQRKGLKMEAPQLADYYDKL